MCSAIGDSESSGVLNREAMSESFTSLTRQIEELYPTDEIAIFGDIEFPPNEQQIFEDSPAAKVTSQSIAEIRSTLDAAHAYAPLMFAARSAIFAARKNKPDILRAGIQWLLIDEEFLDYRDVLVALSLIEDCADRLGVDLMSEFSRHLSVASARRRHTIETGWFSRPKVERTLSVGGLVADSGKNGLYYRKRP